MMTTSREIASPIEPPAETRPKISDYFTRDEIKLLTARCATGQVCVLQGMSARKRETAHREQTWWRFCRTRCVLARVLAQRADSDA